MPRRPSFPALVMVGAAAALLGAVVMPEASAASSVATEAAPTYVTAAAATPTRVVQGRRVVVSGRLTTRTADGHYVGLTGVMVAVQFRASGTTTWPWVASARSDSRGSVSVPVVARRSGSWRLAYAGSSVHRAQFGPAAYVDVSAVTSWVFGHSVRGRALRVYRIGDPNATHRVLVVGVVHGNERAGLKVVNRLRVVAPLRDVVYYLVPNLNPDGTAAGTRQNARGVDLNRNFPYRWTRHGSRGGTYYPGPRPASEPEVRAAERLIRRVSPTLTVWYHQHMNLIDPAAGPRAVARAYGKVAGMRLHKLPAYRGSASTWQGHVWPTRPVFIVELPRTVSAAKADRHARALRKVSALPTG